MKVRLLFIVIFSALALYFTGCLEQKDVLEVSTHPGAWMDEDSPDFHGNAILRESFSLEGCQSCHGEDNRGGTSQVSCFSSACHSIFPHPDGWADSLSANFHEGFIAEELSWQLSACQACHGLDYSGDGFAVKNCRACHTQPEGPEACNTCHGSNVNPAPPVDLENNTETSAAGVGAHQNHLVDSTWSTVYQANTCENCHRLPDSYAAEGHIDNTPHPEVIFNQFASDSLLAPPVWNDEDLTCNNVYCHGGFQFRREDSQNSWGFADSVITGNNPTMLWTGVGVGQAFCGTCHDLPPAGHIAAATCETCHGRVVDANFNIIDKSLHINGQIELF